MPPRNLSSLNTIRFTIFDHLRPQITDHLYHPLRANDQITDLDAQLNDHLHETMEVTPLEPFTET